MVADGKNGLLWDARLDNNDMQYAVRIRAINKGGSLSNEGGKLTVKVPTRWYSSFLPIPITRQTITPITTILRPMWAWIRLATTQDWVSKAEGQGLCAAAGGALQGLQPPVQSCEPESE